MTLSLDEDAERAMRQLDTYYEQYYSRPAEMMKQGAAYYAGPAEGAGEWIDGWVKAGVQHLVVRFTGNHEESLRPSPASAKP